MARWCKSIVFVLVFLIAHPMVLGQQRIETKTWVRFGGGTVGEYCDLLRQIEFIQLDSKKVLDLKKTVPQYANIVVLPRASNLELPQFEIYTNLEGAIRMLDGLQLGRAKITVKKDPAKAAWRIDTELKETSRVVVIDCRTLLGQEFSVTQLIEVVESGLEFVALKAKVQLHKNTGLLFVESRKDGLQLISKIVKHLKSKKSDLGKPPKLNHSNNKKSSTHYSEKLTKLKQKEIFRCKPPGGKDVSLIQVGKVVL